MSQDSLWIQICERQDRDGLHGALFLAEPWSWMRAVQIPELFERRFITTLGNIDPDRVGSSLGGIEISQLGSQSPGIHSNNRVNSRIKPLAPVIDFRSQLRFVEIVTSAIKGFLHNETKESLHSISGCKDPARKNSF